MQDGLFTPAEYVCDVCGWSGNWEDCYFDENENGHDDLTKPVCPVCENSL